MNTRDMLVQKSEELLRLIEREWQADLGSSVCWYGAEGERIRDNAREFLDALRAGTEQDLLKGNPLAEYLGRDWIDSHSSAYKQVIAVTKLLCEST